MKCIQKLKAQVEKNINKINKLESINIKNYLINRNNK